MNVPRTHSLPIYEIMQLISAKSSDCKRYDGDFSDLGNEIGIVVGSLLKMGDDEINDFITGFKHGVSLTNGTHP